MAEVAEVFTDPMQRLRLVEPTTHDVQAAAEGVVLDEDEGIEFFGEHFRLAEKVSIVPMMAFAHAGRKGLDSGEMEGLAAMYSLIRSVVHRPPLVDEQGLRVRDENGKALRDESEWNRFIELAEDEQADDEDVMGFVNRAMEVLAARPTKPREVSSPSSRTTLPTSSPASSLRAMPRDMDGLIPIADLAR